MHRETIGIWGSRHLSPQTQSTTDRACKSWQWFALPKVWNQEIPLIFFCRFWWISLCILYSDPESGYHCIPQNFLFLLMHILYNKISFFRPQIDHSLASLSSIHVIFFYYFLRTFFFFSKMNCLDFAWSENIPKVSTIFIWNEHFWHENCKQVVLYVSSMMRINSLCKWSYNNAW